MLKKFKMWRMKRKQDKQMKEFYAILAKGGAFLKYVLNDIRRSKTNGMNRAMRRRFEREIVRNGTFSQEFINHYAKQVDDVLEAMNKKEK